MTIFSLSHTDQMYKYDQMLLDSIIIHPLSRTSLGIMKVNKKRAA